MNVTARSTNARTCGCIESTSLESIDFWIRGISPSYVRLMLVDLDPGRLLVEEVVELPLRVTSRIGLSGSKKPQPRKMRPYQPSTL